MKKTILIILLVSIVGDISAQQNYYEGQQIFIDNTLTFKCRRSLAGVILSNIHDICLTTRDQEVPDYIDDFLAADIVRSNLKFNSNDAMLKAFHETFTPAELANIADRRMGMHVLFNNNGDIVRLSLGIDNIDKMKAIHPMKYAYLYKRFKAYVKFNVTDKRLYYNFVTLDIILSRVKNRELLFNEDSY